MLHFSMKPESSIALCNSEHPALKHIVSMMARKVPGHDGLYFVKTHLDDCVAVIRPSDRTVSLFNGSFEEFKAHMTGRSTGWFTEAVEVSEGTKHIATSILNEIKLHREG